MSLEQIDALLVEADRLEWTVIKENLIRFKKRENVVTGDEALEKLLQKLRILKYR